MSARFFLSGQQRMGIGKQDVINIWKRRSFIAGYDGYETEKGNFFLA